MVLAMFTGRIVLAPAGCFIMPALMRSAEGQPSYTNVGCAAAIGVTTTFCRYRRLIGRIAVFHFR